MRLVPRQPPGRLNRKALAYEDEIGRLHLDGHSCEAIRRALSDAGITISRSTVIREVSRYSKRRRSAEPSPRTTAYTAVEPPSSVVATDRRPALADDPRSGKEIAAAFVKGRITNPLLRRSHESGGH